MEDSTPSTDPSFFRYRSRVRCIAVLDSCIALFMISIFGFKFWFWSVHQPVPPQALIVFGVFSLQLVMAQLLMTATYHTDAGIALSRCSKWYWTSHFLYVILSIEFIIVYLYHGPLIFPIGKIIFRVIANHLVNLFMIDLRSAIEPAFVPTLPPCWRPEGPPIQGPMSHSQPPVSVSIPSYEPPPTYEEAVRDKTGVV